MPVLKQNHSTPAMREAIVLDLGDIGAQAARIRAAAEAEASKIIAEAQAQSETLAEKLCHEAEQKGFAQGVEKGDAEGREQGRAQALADATEQLNQLVTAWSQVAMDWEQQRIEMEREARQAVLDFALSAAEKIVHRVIEVDESVVVDQAAQALSLVLSTQDATVCVHPVDRPILEDALPELLKELSALAHVNLIEDESITPGGCVVQFGQGRIDATVERQLQRLTDLILPAPLEVEAEEASSDVPTVTKKASGPVAEIDLQGGVDAVTQEVAEPVIKPISEPPVYEITDQGLVQKDGSADGVTPTKAAADESQDDIVTPDDLTPESEA